jgi:polysaccharide biosynthesis transport protein
MKDETLPTITGMNSRSMAMAEEAFSNPEFEQEATSSGLNVHEILLMVFRHKWKIFLCAAGGLIASAAIYFLLPPVYESEAKLFVRYVVDNSAVDGLDSQIKTPNPQTDTVMNSEVEILTSTDLARSVAQAIGVDKLLPGEGSKATLEEATKIVLNSLDVAIVKGSNIISITYKSGNRDLPMPILQELVKRYFDKHLEVHRSIGAFDFVTKETQELQNQLNQTEKELKELKAKAGIVSLTESTASLATELGKAETDLDTAQSELATQRARVKELETSLAVTDPTEPKTKTESASGDVVQKYQALINRLTALQQAETELLSRYTAENRLVKVKQAQIAGLEQQRAELEKKYPALINTVTVTGSVTTEGPRPDLLTERARLAGIQSRVETLTSRVNALKAHATLISEAAPRIEELERKREVEEANYKHSEASLEKARIDETLDPSRMPNISIVQAPSPATKATRDVKKVVLGLAGGGLAVGIAITLLIELVLDRTVKRSVELERRLRIPLLLSIPNFGSDSQRLRLNDAGQNSGEDLSESLALDSGELLRPFCEAIRDRLGLFFELNNMSHKPKLVAVTALARNAGASTLAAGLANTLSEGTEGRVLLVDKPISSKRFYGMLADFKASDLDYVVFDMPSLGGTSSTLPLAGFMDTVLLVVEAGKSDRDAVKRAYSQLAAKTKVSVVFNKTRSYGPKWLEGEL